MPNDSDPSKCRPDGMESFNSTYHTTFDPDTESPAKSVIEAVANALDLDPAVDSIPITNHIDPDGLNAVLRKATSEAYVVVPIWALTVTVHADGHIFIHPPEDDLLLGKNEP